jgi:hypothetical protein
MPNNPNSLNKIHVASNRVGSPPWFSKEKILKGGGGGEETPERLENIIK